jgi:hypothetical protein
MADHGQIKVHELNITNPIDAEVAIQGLGGEPMIFYNMLGNLESMSLNSTMKEIISAYEARNFQEMKN